mgnify:CR=1 FL=1
MKILVAVKRVIDYNVQIRVKEDGTGIVTDNVKMSTNPPDDNAIEEAVKIKEAGKATEIVAVTIGEEKAQETVRKALAVGADRGIHVKVDGVVEPLAVAKILQKIVDKEKPDLVKKFMRAATRSFEEATKNPEAAVDAMLKANAKAGQRDSLIVGLKLTTPLYHTPETSKLRPFRVSPKDMNDSFALLLEYRQLNFRKSRWVYDTSLKRYARRISINVGRSTEKLLQR